MDATLLHQLYPIIPLCIVEDTWSISQSWTWVCAIVFRALCQFTLEPRAKGQGAFGMFEIGVPNGKLCNTLVPSELQGNLNSFDSKLMIRGLVSQESTLGILPPKLQLLHDFPNMNLLTYNKPTLQKKMEDTKYIIIHLNTTSKIRADYILDFLSCYHPQKLVPSLDPTAIEMDSSYPLHRCPLSWDGRPAVPCVPPGDRKGIPRRSCMNTI